MSSRKSTFLRDFSETLAGSEIVNPPGIAPGLGQRLLTGGQKGPHGADLIFLEFDIDHRPKPLSFGIGDKECAENAGIARRGNNFHKTRIFQIIVHFAAGKIDHETPRIAGLLLIRSQRISGRIERIADLGETVQFQPVIEGMDAVGEGKGLDDCLYEEQGNAGI